MCIILSGWFLDDDHGSDADTFIAGKEVALDVAISASQLPTVSGQESSSIDTSSATPDIPNALADQSLFLQ